MEEQANQNNGKSSSKVGLAIIGVIVVAFIGIVAYQSQNQSQNQNTNPQSSPAVTQGAQTETNTTQEAGPTLADQEASAYKDGTYNAVGNYTSPGGQEELGVTLTVASGVVVDSTVEVLATRPMSKTRQTDFSEHYKDMVVGKSIDEITLGKVSGSSLSPKGFNDAVEKIKAEAQS